MKALTICQPYAHLITLPITDERAKRVENRKWPTSHRGPLLIHAGKSRDWLELDDDCETDAEYGLSVSGMAFGAIVAIADLVECFQMRQTMLSGINRASCIPLEVWKARPWLDDHKHVEGPFSEPAIPAFADRGHHLTLADVKPEQLGDERRRRKVTNRARACRVAELAAPIRIGGDVPQAGGQIQDIPGFVQQAGLPFDNGVDETVDSRGNRWSSPARGKKSPPTAGAKTTRFLILNLAPLAL